MKLTFLMIFFLVFVNATPIKEFDHVDNFRITVPLKETVYKKGDMGYVTWINGMAGLLVVKILYGKDIQSLTVGNWAPTIQTDEGPGKFSFFVTPFLF
ncbi:unnamed protein product [Rhizopus stolonifer]